MNDTEIYQKLLQMGLTEEAYRFGELANERYPGNCALYIRDKFSGYLHRIGDDQHDALWVDDSGTVHYSNLQNGDGCDANSINDPHAGYEFVPSDYGVIRDEELAEKWEKREYTWIETSTSL